MVKKYSLIFLSALIINAVAFFNVAYLPCQVNHVHVNSKAHYFKPNTLVDLLGQFILKHTGQHDEKDSYQIKFKKRYLVCRSSGYNLELPHSERFPFPDYGGINNAVKDRPIPILQNFVSLHSKFLFRLSPF
ncbi:hypothetical protein IDJ75_15725 [Mucilaginibacter rigui]|uniref:Uncharacterized protein n=1 Tax=Mucilaginibacter rigui TaxID=534635 RepID=A0ABR7XA75_9SPHI|nr:hypothetical protein [Mucilaginibacter rigui]MBD1386732.1 hypothetical protein [Mucilaginibacter rigui]